MTKPKQTLEEILEELTLNTFSIKELVLVDRKTWEELISQVQAKIKELVLGCLPVPEEYDELDMKTEREKAVRNQALSEVRRKLEEVL